MASKKDGILYLTFGSYLQKIRSKEYQRPILERRQIPTYTELARIAGVSHSTVSRMARGDVDFLNLPVCHAVISEMRRRGFDIDIHDILTYIGPPPRKRPVDLEYDGVVKLEAESGDTDSDELDDGDESNSPDGNEISDAGG